MVRPWCVQTASPIWEVQWPTPTHQISSLTIYIQSIWCLTKMPVVMSWCETVQNIKVYNTAILPVLLYSTETMSLYWHHLRKLTRTQLQHLQTIMHIQWQERVPDVEVLKRAGRVSAEATITARQLRWAGHVSRMPDDQLPKAVFWGELISGNRKTGAPKLRYKDCLKWHLKNAGIDVHTREDKAQDRSYWCGITSNSLIAIEERHLQRYNIVHDRRHSQLLSSDFICSRCHSACCSKAGLTSHSQVCKD